MRFVLCLKLLIDREDRDKSIYFKFIMIFGFKYNICFDKKEVVVMSNLIICKYIIK